MDLQDEKSLVLAAQKDPDAFGALFDLNYTKILSYLVHRTGDVALAQDLSSETFLKAYSKLWQFKWRSISFSAWLYRIAINELRMHFRNKKLVHSLEAMMESTGFDVRDSVDLQRELVEAEEAVKRHGEFLQIQKRLTLLPVAYQEVISLRFFEEKSLNEIAEILGKKEGTIKSLLSRGLEKLRSAQVQPS